MSEPAPGPGLREGYPKVTALGAASGLGAAWGLLGYGVLWEGTPFEVQRPFVQSLPGTLVLMPVRIVIWAIHVVEVAAGRSFDLSRNHGWIALVASAVGAAIATVAYVLGRSVLRRVRGDRRAARARGRGDASARPSSRGGGYAVRRSPRTDRDPERD